MAEKRYFGTMDHLKHNKLSRLELAPQRPTACFGISTSQDLQTSQNFPAYSMPDSEGHGSSGPWSSAAAYLQYASSALNEHLQSREASVKYQKPPAEQQHNPLHLADNQVFVHQSSPGHSYQMSCPRAHPPIAMPRPVYRSPSNFMDTAYGSRGFQSLGVCLASQPLCPPAVEWSSPPRFTHSSSPLYVSGTKKHLSPPSSYLEVAGSPSTLSQCLQEQHPVYRHRADMSLAVGVSSTCSQKDIFTDACYSVAQQNVPLLYAEGNVPGRQRTSAFTTPSPQHNNHKPSAYQGSLDHRMGHLYPKNLYSNTTNSIHQRSSPFSSSMDLTGSPHSVRGSSVYPNGAQHMHSGYVNAELRVQTSHLEGTLQQSERPLQVSPSTHKTITEIPVSSPQRDKNLWVQSGQMNRAICGMSSRTDKEMLFNSTPTNRSLQERTAYQDSLTGQSAHTSFVQQSSSSVITPIVSSQHVSRHSVTLEASSLHSSIHSLADRRVTGVRTVENTNTSHSSRSHRNLDYAESTVPSPSSVSQVDSQYQINHHNHDPKTASTPVSEDVNIDNPKSPPMPVINDVFSLAPYRAYLEGNAPHPFPHQESDVENIASTSTFLEAPLSKDKTEKGKELSSITKVINENEHVTFQNGDCVQTGEQDVSMQNTDVESGVLDLSLKKLPQTGSSPSGQQDFSCHDKDTLLTVDAENCMDKAGKQIQGQENYMPSDTSRMFHFGQERVSAQASGIMDKRSQEKYPPIFINRVSSSGQENTLTNENLLCQRQRNIISRMPKAIPWQLQENWQSKTTETQKNNLEESSASLTKKSLSNQHQEGVHSWDTERLPSKHQKSSPSQVIERLQQKLQKNNPSQDYKSKSHSFQDHNKSHSNKNLSHHPQDNYFSQAPESLPQLSSTTSQTVKTSVQHPSHSNISVFVNTMQTQTTILPVILATTPTVYFANTLEVRTSQPPSRPRQSAKKTLKSCHSQSSPSGSENESNSFHSSKSFMFRKYKMQKFSSSEEETRKDRTDPASQNVSNPFLSDTVQSLPPSAPESSPVLGEANVSLASVGEPFLSSSVQQFSELHRSVQTAITSSVARSPSSVLEDWLSKTKEEDRSKTPVKTKNCFRSNDQDLPDHDIWLAFDGVRLLLHKLLSQLETFMFTRSCPFSHVIRAGAIFIPIYLVKEALFPDLLSSAVDKILQKHKVELRPTTLTEEKFLRETKLNGCSSRMLKLLALKQLPDVYPDLLCLFCRHTIQQQLGKSTQSLDKEEVKLTDSSEKQPKSASPRKVKSSLILKLQRVRKHSGIHVYKTKNPDTPKKKDKLQKSPVCRKKQYRAHPVFSYKKKRRRCTNKRFPNLVGRRILHLFDDGEQEVWFPGRVLKVHRRSSNPRDTQFEVWYDEEPGTRYFLELLQDYEKGWLKLVGHTGPCKIMVTQ